jgi:hypothetical protein
VSLTDWRPGAAVRVRLRETHFVDIREFDLTAFSLLNQLPNFYLSLPELLFIAFFLNYAGFASRPGLPV